MPRLPLFAVAATLLLAAPAAAQDVEYGSIAVVPFGSAIRSEAAYESARILARSVESGLRASGRFMAVLERSAEMDAAIQAEIESATSGDSFESAVRLNTESQMNAKYLLDGYLERFEISQQSGSNFYDAKVALRVRIMDVETRAVILSEVVDITNQLLEKQSGGGGVGGFLRRTASAAVGSTDTSPQDAINKVHDNAPDRVQEMIQQNVSILLVDYEVNEDDEITQFVLLRADDLEEDQDLVISFRAPNRMGGGFRTRDIGKARIETLDTEYAYAEITDGREEITAAVNDNPFMVVVRPEGN